jgi:hypothetical protein
MKLVSKPAEVKLDTDPRILEREHKQRLRVMVHAEKIKGPWACVLYTLRDMGRITRDQADAGDRYYELVKDYERRMNEDPQSELDLRRVERLKRKYRDAIEAMGMVRKYVDEVIFQEIWPVGERGHLAVVQGLELLRILFDTGTKRQRNRRVNVV